MTKTRLCAARNLSEVPDSPHKKKGPQSSRATRLSSDTMLARYFRDMADHRVMTVAEEIQAAQDVEDAEADHWVNLLALRWAATYILPGLQKQVEALGPEKVSAPQLPTLLKLAKKKKLTKAEANKYPLSAELAKTIQLPIPTASGSPGRSRLPTNSTPARPR